MHQLFPYISGSINNVLDSITYFVPEAYLAALFIIVLVTDLLFRKTSASLCKLIVCAGLLLILFKDFEQSKLLFTTAQVNGHFIFNGMLLLNRTAISFKYIIDGLAFVLLLYFSWDDQLNAHPKGLSDLYTIAIGSVLGLHLMIMAVNLLSIYLAIEMVSIASYLMVAYKSERIAASESGLKYVLFGAACSAIMLYGISLLYAFTGSLSLFGYNLVPGLVQVNSLAVLAAMSLVFIGIGFKLSFVPLHFWVPDVYQGAPTPVTAWLSTLPKIAGFALLLNFLSPFINFTKGNLLDFKVIISVLGVITLIIGNFAAVLQQNVKRMLAYSSIGHTGFALMAVAAYGDSGIPALIYYLAVYAIANIGALALATYFENNADATEMKDYRGLGIQFPAASVCFVIILISLTGLPVTAGFTGKLLVFTAVYSSYENNHNIWLLLLLLTGAATTVIALFYYIRIPLNLFLKRSEKAFYITPVFGSIVILTIIIAISLVLLGIFPNFLLNIL